MGGVIVCIFRSRVRPDADLAALAALDRELDALVRTIPGFVSNKAAKARGRSSFFAELSVQACAPFHVARHP